MQNEKTKQLVLAGLMTAITVVMTMFVAIPVPNVTGAFVNCGDAAVYTSAFLLGGPVGAVAAGIGSALADLFWAAPFMRPRL